MYTFLECSDLSETKNECFHLNGTLFMSAILDRKMDTRLIAVLTISCALNNIGIRF